MLVPYSMAKGKPTGKSFIVPINDGKQNQFVTLNNGVKVDFATVVYIGRTVSVEDVFKKIVDAGFVVLPSTDEMVDLLSSYIDLVSKLKIGDVVKVGFDEVGQLLLEKQRRPITNQKSRFP
jgi:PDZ domain-containing secreted protein